MGKAKTGAKSEAGKSSPKREDAEDESSEGQGMLLNLYESLQTELREVRVHLLKLEMESHLRELKFYEDVSALEKLVEEQGLHIHQLEQQKSALGGRIVDGSDIPEISSAQVFSYPTFVPEAPIEPESENRVFKPVLENTVFLTESIVKEVLHAKSQSLSRNSFSSQDVEGRNPNSFDVLSCFELVMEGTSGDVGGDRVTSPQVVETKTKGVRPESELFVETLDTASREVGSESECTVKAPDSAKEDLVDSNIFLKEMLEVGSSSVGNDESSLIGPIDDGRDMGSKSSHPGEIADNIVSVVGETSWTSTEVFLPKVEVIWRIENFSRSDSEVIKFVEDVLNKHEVNCCSSRTEEVEDSRGEEENVGDAVEIDSLCDKLNVNIYPAEAERLEKDPEGSGTVTETMVFTEKPNMDFHAMTVKRLEKEQEGLYRNKIILLHPKYLDPRGRCCRLPKGSPVTCML